LQVKYIKLNKELHCYAQKPPHNRDNGAFSGTGMVGQSSPCPDCLNMKHREAEMVKFAPSSPSSRTTASWLALVTSNGMSL
jgi:hypothetical protein